MGRDRLLEFRVSEGSGGDRVLYLGRYLLFGRFYQLIYARNYLSRRDCVTCLQFF